MIKKFGLYIIIRKWKLIFMDITFHVTSERSFNDSKCFLRKHLLSKTDYFTSFGYKLSHIFEMNITFITEYRNMTYEHYLKQPKQVVEWRLNEKLSKNPELIRAFDRKISHPLNQKNSHSD